MANHKLVILYALSTCIHCRALAEFLEGSQIDFSVVNIDELEGKERRDMFKALKRLNPQCTFPTLVVKEQVVVGYKLEEIREILNISRMTKDDLF